MAMSKVSDIRRLTDEEISQEVIATKRCLFDLRMQKGTGHLEKTHLFRRARRRLAQLLTIEQERKADRAREDTALNVYDYGKVSFPKKIRVGKIYPLDVVIRPFPQEANLSSILNRTIQPRTINAYLVVSPMDFELKDSNVKAIEIGDDERPHSVTFELIPKKEGEKRVGVEFFQRSSYLGRADLKTKAVF